MRIIIVITRMMASRGGGDDEFVKLWGGKPDGDYAIWSFNDGQDILYVYHGCWQRFDNDWQRAEQKTVKELCEQLSRDIQQDLGQYIGQSEVGVLVHPPMGIEQELIQSISKGGLGFKPSFVIATGGHAGVEEVNQKLSDISSVLRNQGPLGLNFGELWNFFCKAPSTPAEDLKRRLSILKHRIAHLFLPIYIDLQGLIETGFREDYWDEVVDAYKDGKAKQALEEARKLVYEGEEKRDTVEKIVKEARMESHPVWNQVQSLLPKNRGLPNDVEQILQDLGCQNKREVVKQKCGDRSNPFHQWFTELDKALDNLREALPKKGSAAT